MFYPAVAISWSLFFCIYSSYNVELEIIYYNGMKKDKEKKQSTSCLQCSLLRNQVNNTDPSLATAKWTLLFLHISAKDFALCVSHRIYHHQNCKQQVLQLFSGEPPVSQITRSYTLEVFTTTTHLLHDFGFPSRSF